MLRDGKGAAIVKLVDVGRRGSGLGSEAAGAQDPRGTNATDPERKAFALRPCVVFNAQQMDGFPPLEASETLFDPIAKRRQ